MGMNLSRLSSIAAHRNNQFELEIVIKVLITITDIDNIVKGEYKVNIKTRRS